MPNVRLRASSIVATVALLVSLALPGVADAQSRPDQQRLRLPTVAFGAAAMADWATTYHALKNYQVREANPILRPLDHEPFRMVGLGAAIDVGLASSWNLVVGRDHPRVAAAGLWAMTAFRAYLAFHNMRNIKRSARR